MIAWSGKSRKSGTVVTIDFAESAFLILQAKQHLKVFMDLFLF
jgi:hypothetical protein